MLHSGHKSPAPSPSSGGLREELRLTGGHRWTSSGGCNGELTYTALAWLTLTLLAMYQLAHLTLSVILLLGAVPLIFLVRAVILAAEIMATGVRSAAAVTAMVALIHASAITLSHALPTEPDITVSSYSALAVGGCTMAGLVVHSIITGYLNQRTALIVEKERAAAAAALATQSASAAAALASLEAAAAASLADKNAAAALALETMREISRSAARNAADAAAERRRADAAASEERRLKAAAEAKAAAAAELESSKRTAANAAELSRMCKAVADEARYAETHAAEARAAEARAAAAAADGAGWQKQGGRSAYGGRRRNNPKQAPAPDNGMARKGDDKRKGSSDNKPRKQRAANTSKPNPKKPAPESPPHAKDDKKGEQRPTHDKGHRVFDCNGHPAVKTGTCRAGATSELHATAACGHAYCLPDATAGPDVFTSIKWSVWLTSKRMLAISGSGEGNHCMASAIARDITTSREGHTQMTNRILNGLQFAGKLLHTEFSGKGGATKIKNFTDYFPGFGSIPFDGGAKKEDLDEFRTMGGKGGFEGGRAIATAALILFGGKIAIKVYDATSDLPLMWGAGRPRADVEMFSMRAEYSSEAATHDIHLILNGEGTHYWTASPTAAWTFAQNGSISRKPFTAGVTPAPPKMLSQAEIQALIAKAVRGPSSNSAAAKPSTQQQPASPAPAASVIEIPDSPPTQPAHASEPESATGGINGDATSAQPDAEPSEPMGEGANRDADAGNSGSSAAASPAAPAPPALRRSSRLAPRTQPHTMQLGGSAEPLDGGTTTIDGDDEDASNIVIDSNRSARRPRAAAAARRDPEPASRPSRQHAGLFKGANAPAVKRPRAAFESS